MVALVSDGEMVVGSWGEETRKIVDGTPKIWGRSMCAGWCEDINRWIYFASRTLSCCSVCSMLIACSVLQAKFIPAWKGDWSLLPFRSEGQISTKFVVVVVAAVESKWRCLISAAAAAAAGSAMSSNDAAAVEVLTLAIAVVVVVVVVVAVVALAVVVVEVMVVVAVEVVVRLVDGRLLEELARRESEQV